MCLLLNVHVYMLEYCAYGLYIWATRTHTRNNERIIGVLWQVDNPLHIYGIVGVQVRHAQKPPSMFERHGLEKVTWLHLVIHDLGCRINTRLAAVFANCSTEEH